MGTSPLRRGLFALGWALLIAACLCGLSGMWLFGTTLGLIGEAHTTEGVVVAHETVMVNSTRNRSGGLGKRSVVRFRAADGNVYTITEGLVRQLDAIHDLGETVTVRYHPDVPGEADVVWPWLRGIGAVVMLATAAVGVLVGGLLVLLVRPHRGRGAP